MLVPQKPNSEKIKMIKQVIGGAGVVLGAGYAIYSILGGDYSSIDVLGGVGAVMAFGELGRRGEEAAKENSKLARQVTEETRD